MITKGLVTDLMARFKGIDLSKGHVYLTSNRVMDVHFTVPDMVVFGKVKDQKGNTEITSLMYNDVSNDIQNECSCSKKSMCEHAAALALFVLRNNQDIKVANDAIFTRFASSKANQWRTLHRENDAPWTSILDSLLQRKRTQSRVEGSFLPNNHISFLLSRPFSDKSQEVELKVAKDEFGIICHHCTSSTNMFCEHQSETMRFVLRSPMLRDWMEEKVNYEIKATKLSEDRGLDLETFNDLFAIEFDKEGIYIEAKSGSLYAQGTGKALSEQFQMLDIDEEKSIIAERKDHSLFGQAMVWFFDYTNSGYTFLEGKLNKGKTQLINTFNEITYPDQFEADILNVVDTMIKLKFSIKSNASAYNTAFLELLQLNIPVLNDCRHYAFKGKSFDNEASSFIPLDSMTRKITKKYLKPFHWSNQLCEHFVHVTSKKGVYMVSLKTRINGQTIERSILSNLFFSIVDDIAYIHESVLPESHFTLKQYLEKMIIFKDDFHTFLPFLFDLENHYEIIWDESVSIDKAPLAKGQFELYIEENGEFITLEPRIQYQDISFNVLKEKNRCADGKVYEINTKEVSDYLEILASLHPKLDSKQTHYGFFVLSYTDLLSGMWFLDFFDTCKKNHIEVFGKENLSKLHFNQSIPSITSHIKSNQDWFDVEVDIQFGDQKVSMAEWIAAIRNKSRYIKLHDGSLGVISDAWFKKLREIYEMSDHSKGQLQVNQFKFDEIQEVFAPDEIDGGELFEKLREKKERLESFEKEKTYPLPSILNAELRQYQWVGYQWLRFLDDFKMGGILADEMGLGKTLQIITLLAYFKEQSVEHPSLIIVPRSLLFNWVDEIKKFCPTLKAKIHHGLNREVDYEEFLKFDVIITTYDTAVQDQKKLQDMKFHYIVLDESQAIKNPMTKRFQAVTKLQAENRLAMTGTPIENNTFDLYAQFSFVNPGIFGSANHFKNNYSRPIDVLEDERVSKKLQRIISPYILRRTKRQVAEDLPPKTESILYCELKPAQREMYEALKNKIREDIMVSMADKKNNNKTSFLAVEGLLRLRQICNSPYLVDKNLPPSKRESSKLNKLIDSLQNDLDGSSALVFSQFTSMLALIRERLDELNIKYSYLDGSTKDRRSVVEQFQEDDSCKIFLISLKAGNMGLNLTKAEYVYIVDPWWNPAVEAQAIDRTHRIGQDKHIIAYRMICEDTIEEKIVNLQKKKKKLASDLIHSEEEMFKSLKKEDLLGLFDL